MTEIGPKTPRVRRKVNPEPQLLAAEVREWRVLREFPDYEISNDGRLRRCTNGSNMRAGTLIRIGHGGSRYPTYGLTRPDGRRAYRNAHRLVAVEFLPPPHDGMMKVLHHDDNRLNCLDTNLKWGNDEINTADAKRNGKIEKGPLHSSARKPWLRPRGEVHSKAKLSESDVLSILSDLGKQRDIADAYGVDQALIGRIKQGKVWKHITNPEYQKMLLEGAANG